MRRLRAEAFLGTHAVHPADQLEVEIRVAAEVVVHAASGLRADRAGCRRGRRSDTQSSMSRASTAPSGPARGPSQASLSASRSRQNIRLEPCLRPGTSTSTASGSLKPLRYQKSLSCRYGNVVSLLRMRSFAAGMMKMLSSSGHVASDACGAWRIQRVLSFQFSRCRFWRFTTRSLYSSTAATRMYSQTSLSASSSASVSS